MDDIARNEMMREINRLRAVARRFDAVTEQIVELAKMFNVGNTDDKDASELTEEITKILRTQAEWDTIIHRTQFDSERGKECRDMPLMYRSVSPALLPFDLSNLVKAFWK